MNRVLVAVDSSTDRRLITALLESDPEFVVIGEAGNGLQAAQLAASLEPDMVVIDLDMTAPDGIEVIQSIMERCPTRIVALTSSGSGTHPGRGAESLNAGALIVVSRPDHPNSPQFSPHRDRFMELIRAASHEMIGSGKDPHDPGAKPIEQADRLGLWTRQPIDLTLFDGQQILDDATPEAGFWTVGQPFTMEGRAARLRRLLDEIEGEF